MNPYRAPPWTSFIVKAPMPELKNSSSEGEAEKLNIFPGRKYKLLLTNNNNNLLSVMWSYEVSLTHNVYPCV